jgi:hypothetical protein
MPFTIKEFLEVMAQYNNAVWPMQLLLLLLAIVALALAFTHVKFKNKIINGILAFLWTWMGVVYHIAFFSSINKAALLFGGIFIIQGFIFAYFGAIRNDKLQYHFNWNFAVILGLLFLLYALIIYPILADAFGHTYPSMPTFGLPCPTTIFTFGILLFAAKRIPWYTFVIPFLWSLIGFSAAFNLNITEDYGLVFAGVVGTAVLLFNRPPKISTLKS